MGVERLGYQPATCQITSSPHHRSSLKGRGTTSGSIIWPRSGSQTTGVLATGCMGEARGGYLCLGVAHQLLGHQFVPEECVL
ncbi:hypothetical protein [[Phormidium] sp. ETS-05]|uniref:hypothetical protein n=1 Tax=[Phormidium] sp. ETS-05 TaxID=222819 RepID=UPI0018EF268F|nr:hypothetical protein [[Phormidium] sp. ETS-05]